ncbi:Putative cytosolic protein [Staphylococcus saccharolyticus]|uniref:Cytosolic protein n=1 Tax=Staphylococcus saccharolyticus TaxID=33028 RepID=A0A380H6L1_9STAP|nr:hypothetical protein [Staphylococcus saccharolyticus]SUM71835.1 Putative cytosolic protein [Staphylococcus saccharolyticus]
MNYSENASIKLSRILEVFDEEMNRYIKLQEMRLEADKDVLRRNYLKQPARIKGDEST